MRIIGPNCVGFIRPQINLNTTFLLDNPSPGPIAFISQSGAIGSAILDWAKSSNMGFGMFISLGSMLDIDYGDLIDYLGEGDPTIKSILIYMENVGNAKKFMSAARGFAKTKPIIVLKAGKHAAGAKAASSHTGALAGDYQVYAAAFRRTDAVQVSQIEDLFDCASVLDSKSLPAGSRLGIITNAGGPGVLASDFIADYGVELAKLTDQTKNVLNANLPKFWSGGNPVDRLGDAGTERYRVALNTCDADPNVDSLLVIYTPQGAAAPVDVAKEVARLVAASEKPTLTVRMGEDRVEPARKIFYQSHIPTYPTPEEAVRAYMYMYPYKRNLELLYQTPEKLQTEISSESALLKKKIEDTLKQGRNILNQQDADQLLDSYDIPRAKAALATSAEEACSAASKIGYPVVMKISSPDVMHKTDAGGVATDLNSQEEVKHAYSTILERVKKVKPDAKIDGVYVQKMQKDIDYELILGSKKDKDFGAVILLA